MWCGKVFRLACRDGTSSDTDTLPGAENEAATRTMAVLIHRAKDWLHNTYGFD